MNTKKPSYGIKTPMTTLMTGGYCVSPWNFQNKLGAVANAAMTPTGPYTYGSSSQGEDGKGRCLSYIDGERMSANNITVV